MGNKIARTTQASATEYYLHDLPSTYNLVLLDVVSRGRFLKSVRCKHDEGLLLVKVYFKRAGEPIDLKEHERRLERIRNAFKGIEGSHVWPFQVWLQTDKAAYLLRQYFHNNLHDRLSTRPFLSQIVKKWLAFQLIHAVEQSHSKGVCHGDIKCENVLVTSWNWLYLADFASFKPTYIPDDDPSDFSFYFDTGGRRRCYLAPERFYEHGSEAQVAADAPLQPSMDIFSLGCVLAELFLEGQPLFELSQLLAYRRGQYDPMHTLEKIQDSGIRDMILHMTQLDPKERLSCRSYLQKYESVVFPIYFSNFLHKFFSDIVPLDSDTRVEKTQENFEKIHEIMMSGSAIEQIVGSTLCENKELSEEKGIRRQMTNSPGDSAKNTYVVKKNIPIDHQQIVGDLNFLLKEVEHRSNHTCTKVTQGMDHFVASSNSCASVIQAGRQIGSGLMGQNNAVSYVQKISKSNLRSLVAGYDGQSDTYSFDIFQQIGSKVTCEGMVLLASLLCSCIRSVKKPELRRTSLILLKFSSTYIDDDSRLQLVVPYVIAMLSDPAAIVRCAALETLCDVLCLVQDFPISDAVIFLEYILPMLSLLPDDAEESVRVCYASNIHKLALTAYRFLLRSCSMTDIGPLDESVVALRSQSTESPVKKQDKIDGQLADLRKSIYEIVQELVMGQKQTPNVRRALLQDIGYLCYFFGHKQSNDFLLPILPAFLNDRDEQLRAVFFGQIVFVCYFIGSRSVEEYLLPYLEQALSDAMEAVLVNALDCLTMMCKSGYLRKRVIVGLFGKALPLLCYPINWVKRSAVRLVAACSESLGSVDTYVYLSPHLRHFLHREPPSLTSETALLSCLKPPVSKSVLYQALEDSQDMGDILLKNGGKKELTVHGVRYPATVQSRSSTILEDAARLRSPNISSNMSLDIKDSVSSDKSLYSGFALHASAGNSSFYDGLSKGIPSYSVFTDKRGLGETHMVPDSSVYKASIRLPWLEPNRPGVQTRDDHFSSKRRDLSINDSMKSSSSLPEDSISNSDTPGLPSFTRSGVALETGWRPRGVLVAHLQEHRLSVNDIAVSNDNTFFVTASDDSSIKIWDSRKLEKDIAFRSRLTYSLGSSRALCTEMLHGTSQVAVGASDGTLHLFSVDCARGVGSVVERYSGIVDVKRKDMKEGAILSVVNCSSDSFSPTVLFSTEHCGIHKWDTRTNSESWSFKSSPGQGYISALVVGQCGNWFISGSSRGVLTLWDNRFLLPVNSWNYSTVSPIEKLCLLIPPPNSISSSGRPLVFVAAGCNEVSLWNAENGSCHQMFRTASTENEGVMPKAPSRPLNKSSTKDARRTGNYKYRIDELNDPPARRPGIRSLLPLPGGDLLTGGTDLKIRYWDQARPEQSFCIAGPLEKEIDPSAKGVGNGECYDIRSSFGVQVVQEICKKPTSASGLTHKTRLAMAAADSAGCHRDAILALASFNLSSQRLISASRDGAIKVWK
ncbi:serine/threonine-protein kinase VPS15-like [Phragmites australis]|uniref:serine/threonine-protein kinase VPS15-like n=1 Tax=Phragmites australis TaxID=29695 RepID=UPI002D778715|nr:serine/threonine-protein kinase VPS15-like [Phragmites australis]XP_062221697.1 serine/threonine-protein kinase VPS15-like [Phragmites australis]XP_062221698.1 serine/threonine-protein kinase VPS15-like [Phragmites australis]